MLEVYLRSCCCRSTFDICMVHLVLHGMWRWFSWWCMEMVASWGLMGFLVKVWFMFLSLVWGWFHYYVMVYSWYAFRVVTCYSMFIWSMLSLLRWLGHVVMFMFLRPWLELWHWSWFKFLGIEYTDHKLDTSWYCYVAFGVGMDWLVTGAHEYLEMVVMLISLGWEKYLLGQLFSFS